MNDTVAAETIDPELQAFLSEYQTPSIDNPPKEEQIVMFKSGDSQTEEESEAEAPKTFGYELKLVLKPNVKGKSYTLPICSGVTYPNRVEYVLDKNFNGSKFRTILHSIVGHIDAPKQEAQAPELSEPVIDEIDWGALNEAFEEPIEKQEPEPMIESEEF